MSKEEQKAIILAEYAKGNICYAGPDGISAQPLKEFIRQPVEGILYDLNRSEPVVLTFLDDPKWINDYAVAKVIRALKERVDAATFPRWVKASERTPRKEVLCHLRLDSKRLRVGYYFEGSGAKSFVISPGMDSTTADEIQFSKIEWLEEKEVTP